MVQSSAKLVKYRSVGMRFCGGEFAYVGAAWACGATAGCREKDGANSFVNASTTFEQASGKMCCIVTQTLARSSIALGRL